MQKHVNLVDLVKSFPTNIYLQNLASIQKRTSSVKFAHLAEKSGKGSIPNLSTKAQPLAEPDASRSHRDANSQGAHSFRHFSLKAASRVVLRAEKLSQSPCCRAGRAASSRAYCVEDISHPPKDKN